MVLNMDNKKVFLIFISLVFMINLAAFVFAQEGTDFSLVEIFETVRGFDVAEAYGTFPFLIDTIIYFILFISIAQVTLGKQFEGPGGKGVVIAVGLAMAVAISFWAKNVGFTLGNLGPLAGLILALIIGIKIYRLLRGNESVGSGIWISIIVLYIGAFMFFPEIITALQTSKAGRLGLAILNIAFIIALPMAIISLFRGGGGVGGGGVGGGVGGGTPWGGLWPGGGRGRGGRDQRDDDEKDDKEIEAEEKKELMKEMKDTAAELNLIKDIYDKIKVEREELIQIKDHGSSDWADEVTKYNAKITDIHDELDDVEKLNTKIRTHIQMILDTEKLRGVKGESARKRISARRDIARRVKTQLDVNTFIDNIVVDAMGKLNTTKTLGNMFAQLRTHFSTTTPPVASVAPYPPVNTIVPNPYTTYPPPNALFTLPAVEFNVLQQVLDEMKRVHALAAELYKSERGLGVRIQDIS